MPATEIMIVLGRVQEDFPDARLDQTDGILRGCSYSYVKE